MRDREGHVEFERISQSLNDPEVFAEYKAKHDDYVPSRVARAIGFTLEQYAHFMYGDKAGYLLFRAIEVVARVPYQSWDSVAFTSMTLFFSDEERALKLSKIGRYASLAQENETMHVVVISHLAKEERMGNAFTRTIFPICSAFFYYLISYGIYVFSQRLAFELNFIFESNALRHYSHFVERHEAELKVKNVKSDFLKWYGRKPANQYEFFRSVRNDELIHRNKTVEVLRSM